MRYSWQCTDKSPRLADDPSQTCAGDRRAALCIDRHQLSRPADFSLLGFGLRFGDAIMAYGQYFLLDLLWLKEH